MARALDHASAERIALLHRLLPTVLAANLAAAGLTAAVMVRVQPAWQVALWLAAVLVAVAVRLALWLRGRAAPASPRRAAQLTAEAAVSGLLWGALAWWLFPEPLLYQMFLAFVIGGMAAGATASLTVFPPAYIGFLLPAVLPLAARFALEGTGIYLAMAALVAVFAAALALIARTQYLTLERSFELTRDKTRLAEQLAQVLQGQEQQVRDRTEALRAANERLQREIAERQRAEEAERAARALADRASAAKSRFLAAASHDLRQPFQGMELYLQALQRELNTDRQHEIAAHLGRTVEAGRNLLDVLMDLSALESGAVQPRLRALRVDELVRRIGGEYRLLAEDKGLQLKVRAGRPVWVRSDPVLLERMLRNLVANAVRYTAQGRILLAVRRRKGGVRLEVWDTGPGVPDQHREAIFDDFYQVPAPRSARPEGLGLGLSIVARLAQLLGHPIEVRSRSGRGSLFAVSLAETDEPRP